MRGAAFKPDVAAWSHLHAVKKQCRTSSVFDMFDKISVCSFSFSGLKCFVVEDWSDCQNRPKNLWWDFGKQSNHHPLLYKLLPFPLIWESNISVKSTRCKVFSETRVWTISVRCLWTWSSLNDFCLTNLLNVTLLQLLVIKYFEKRFVKVISCGVSTCNNHNIYIHFINSPLTGWLII